MMPPHSISHKFSLFLKELQQNQNIYVDIFDRFP